MALTLLNATTYDSSIQTSPNGLYQDNVFTFYNDIGLIICSVICDEFYRIIKISTTRGGASKIKNKLFYRFKFHMTKTAFSRFHNLEIKDKRPSKSYDRRKLTIKNPVIINHPEQVKKSMLTNNSFIHLELTSSIYNTASMVYLAISNNSGSYFFSEQALQSKYIVNFLKNRHIHKVAYDFKRISSYLLRHKIHFECQDDMKLMFLLLGMNVVYDDNEDTKLKRAMDITDIGNALNFEMLPLPRKKSKQLPSYAKYISQKPQFMKEVYPITLESLKNNNLHAYYQTIEFPFVRILLEMEQNGFEFSLDEFKLYRRNVQIRIDELATLCGSNPDKKNLDTLRDMRSWLTTIDNYHMQHEKLGKITAQYEPVKTFRYTTSASNIQGIPKIDDTKSEFRKCITARPGKSFISIDASQIELRILADMSNDNHMLSAFNEGKDLHRITASAIFEVPYEQVSDQQRKIGKLINFGTVYGQTVYGLREGINELRKGPAYQTIQRDLVSNYILSFKELYPQTEAYKEQNMLLAKEQEFITTKHGAIIQLKEINYKNHTTRKHGERRAFNNPIQGTAAEILKIGTVRLKYAFQASELDVSFLAQIYDEWVLEVCDEDIKQVLDTVHSEFSKGFDLKVQLEFDTVVGKTLYDIK